MDQHDVRIRRGGRQRRAHRRRAHIAANNADAAGRGSDTGRQRNHDLRDGVDGAKRLNAP